MKVYITEDDGKTKVAEGSRVVVEVEPGDLEVIVEKNESDFSVIVGRMTLKIQRV